MHGQQYVKKWNQQ